MDHFRLIEEVRKRPILWNSQLINRPLNFIADSWEEVASILGNNVTTKDCKYEWKKLRGTYRKLYLDLDNLKRNRIETDKQCGIYNPKKNYDSKWVYYKQMSFLNKIFLHHNPNWMDNENSLPASEISMDNITAEDSDEEEQPLSSSKRITRSHKAASSSINKIDKQYSQFNNSEPEHELDAESYTTDDEEESWKPTKRPRHTKETNSSNRKSFENQDTQQQNNAIEAVNVSISEKDYNKIHSKNMLKDLNDLDHCFLLSFADHLKSMSQLQNLHFRTKMSELILSILTSSLSDDKRKTQEITIQAETLLNGGDLDSNFLISFWPYMKLMTQLENLQFRSKISDILLNILSTHED